MRITSDQILQYRHSLTLDEVKISALTNERKSWTPKELAEFEKIPLDDRFELLCLFLPDPGRYARRVAFDVVDLWKAPAIARKYLTTGCEGLWAAGAIYKAKNKTEVWSEKAAACAAYSTIPPHPMSAVDWAVCAAATAAASKIKADFLVAEDDNEEACTVRDATMEDTFKKYFDWALEEFEESTEENAQKTFCCSAHH